MFCLKDDNQQRYNAVFQASLWLFDDRIGLFAEPRSKVLVAPKHVAPRKKQADIKEKSLPTR